MSYSGGGIQARTSPGPIKEGKDRRRRAKKHQILLPQPTKTSRPNRAAFLLHQTRTRTLQNATKGQVHDKRLDPRRNANAKSRSRKQTKPAEKSDGLFYWDSTKQIHPSSDQTRRSRLKVAKLATLKWLTRREASIFEQNPGRLGKKAGVFRLDLDRTPVDQFQAPIQSFAFKPKHCLFGIEGQMRCQNDIVPAEERA